MKRDAVCSLLKSCDALDLDSLIRQAGEAVVLVDHDWRVQYCNDVYLQNIGLPRDAVIGHTPFEYEPSFEQSVFYETIDRCRGERKPTAKLGYSTIVDRWLLVRVFPTAGGTMVLANDASEQVVKQHHLAQQVTKDSLTGLPNKLALLQKLDALRAAGERSTVLLVGLDRFRGINDAMGYAVGDMALLEAASRLQTSTRAGEELYRFNGDEFVVLHRLKGEAARQRATSLIEAATGSPLVIHGHRFVLGATCGCVEHGPGSSDSDTALSRAALALRQAKRTARGSMVFHDPSLEQASQLRAQLEGELRAAIDAQALQLHFQPKGCLVRGAVVGAEALIRWPHPARGLLGPDDFLQLAGEAGLMRSIDKFVLEQALGRLDDLAKLGVSVPLSINLSASSLGDLETVDRVREALRSSAVPAQLLEIEIPEGALMQDVDASAKVLAAFNDMGIKISVDDFGTGYSSFAYLARFPVHALKVDRSFVKDMTTSPTSRKIVEGMVRMAHSLQMQVVAEGAEGAGEMDLLRRIGCDMVQGYAFARPMPFSDFVACVSSQRQRRSGLMSPMTI